MKITAAEVYGAAEAIKKLSAEKLPVKGAYWLARVAAKLEPEFTAIDKQRTELIKKYGEEKDGQIAVTGDNLITFSNDFSDILAQEIDVDCPTVKLDLLGDDSIPAGLLIPLTKFIDES